MKIEDLGRLLDQDIQIAEPGVSDPESPITIAPVETCWKMETVLLNVEFGFKGGRVAEAEPKAARREFRLTYQSSPVIEMESPKTSVMGQFEAKSFQASI